MGEEESYVLKKPLLDVEEGDKSTSGRGGGSSQPPAPANNTRGGKDANDDDDDDKDPPLVKAFNYAVKVAGTVNRILPAATYLIFQFFLPLASNGGSCGNAFQDDPVNVYTILTLLLLILFSLISFALIFTDSVKLSNGKVYHGIVTPWGLWLPKVCEHQLTEAAKEILRTEYRLRLIDVLHGFLSLAIFLASALVRTEVSSCLQITALITSNTVIPSLVVNSLPIVVGFVAGAIYLALPTNKRIRVDRPLLERQRDRDVDAIDDPS